MKSAVYFVLGLIFGSAGGAYISKLIVERKMEDKIEKATSEARNYYKDKYKPKKEEKPPVEKSEPKKPPVEFTRIYGKAFEVNEETIDEDIRENIKNAETYAYEISPEEFGEDCEYTTYSLDYYSDGSLVDETGNLVDDPVHLVGGDVLDGISMENPTAYVRNDITKTDYEITYVDDEFDSSGGLDD